MSDNGKWQQIVDSIPSGLKSHFKGSTAELGATGLIVSLPSPAANILAIEKQIQERYILPKVVALFGEGIKVHYQRSLPAMPEPAAERIRVVDKRPRQPFFMVDNSLFRDGHAARMKPNGVTIYLCLVMHVGSNDKCWPSYDTIGKLVGMSRRNIIRICSQLEKLGYIQIEPVFSDKGEPLPNNFYILKYPDI